MYQFEYHRAASVEEAAAKVKSADDGTLMAGGMTLLPTLKQRLASPSDVVDLAGIADLKGISVNGDTVTIGATTTHDAVANSGEVAGAIPALAALAGGIGDPQVRNCGTIGGSIANNDPAADYPAALLGLGATVHTDQREIAADDFFTGLFDSARARWRRRSRRTCRPGPSRASRLMLAASMPISMPAPNTARIWWA
jgi:carbon-monoxide dehydrogenase medium subunit